MVRITILIPLVFVMTKMMTTTMRTDNDRQRPTMMMLITDEDEDNDCDDGDNVIYLVRRFEAAGTEGHQCPPAGHAVITRVSRQLFAQMTIYLVPTLDAIQQCYKPHLRSGSQQYNGELTACNYSLNGLRIRYNNFNFTCINT